MERMTFLVLPEGATGPVRSFQVPTVWLRRAAIGAVVTLVLGVAGIADWVSLRLDATDVAGLRVEADHFRGELEQVHATVEEIEERVTRLGDLERKVRVIADLPGAKSERAAVVSPAAGQGGSEGEDLEAEQIGEPAAPDAPEDASAPVSLGAPEPDSALGLDPAALARVQAKAAQLVGLTRNQEHSLAGLVEELRGRAHRLAATPSIWPAEGWLTSAYGPRISPFTGRRTFHAGVDIAGSLGTAVVAPASGRVVFVGRKGAFGNTVVLDHGFGTRTLFGHNQKILVKPGEPVERGQQIAAIGNTGRSTGPHVHYAVEVNGRSRNPLDYVFE